MSLPVSSSVSLPMHIRRQRYERGYVFITAIFAVLMILTNIIGTKLFALFPNWMPSGFGVLSGNGPVILTTGLITYPLTFLFTDIASEIYGSRRAKIMVTIGFVSSILMLLVVNLAIFVTPADRYWSDASGQLSYEASVLSTFGVVKDGTGGFIVELSNREHLAQDSHQSLVQIALLRGDTHIEFTDCMDIIEGTVDGSADTYRKVSARILSTDVQVNDIIVPAVRGVEFSSEGSVTRMRIESGQMLPAQGILRDQTGATYAYTHEAGTAWLQMAQPWPESFNNQAQSFALVNYAENVAMQSAMVATFASPGILLVASMLAYLAAQFLDVYLYHYWKRVTKGKMLWLRNNGSTWGSQLVDTIIVNGIFLPVAFGMNFSQTVSVIVCVYLVKIVLAALDTPLIYLAVYYCKRHLGYAMDEDVPELIHNTEEASP